MTTDPVALNRFLDALEAAGSRTARQGHQKVTATCPAHEDRNPSLSLTAIEGRVLVHCFAGCHVDDVLAALGLHKRDLFDDPRGARYDYADAAGTITRTVTRTPQKRFRQEGQTRAPSTLFRLPEVLDAVAAGRPVHLVEGEQDVLALESLGATATTAPMGAANFAKVDVSPLDGAHVVAIPDQDEMGQKWAESVRERLSSRVKSLTWRQPATGKDAADHVAAGHGIEDLLPDRDAELEEQLAFNREVSESVHRLHVRKAAQDRFTADLAAADPAPPFDAGSLAEILARPAAPPMRAEGIIPAEAGVLVVAQRKTGKTTLMLNYARSLIAGRDFLDRFPVRPLAGNVALLNYEVSGATVARWAHEHGIPGDRLHLVNLRGRRNPLAHPEDRAELAAWLRRRETEALIVDPFGRAFIGKSQNDPGDVGAWLVDLDMFARTEAGVTDVMLTAHAGWNGERTRGSSALEDWADSIIWMTRDPEDESQRFLRATGRDVDVEEDRLDFTVMDRSLTLAGVGSRKQAATTRGLEELLPAVLEAVENRPGITGYGLDTVLREAGEVAFHKGDGAKAAQLGVQRKLLRVESGARNSNCFYLTSPTSPPPPRGDINPTSPTSLYMGEVGGGEVIGTSPPGRWDDANPLAEPNATSESGSTTEASHCPLHGHALMPGACVTCDEITGADREVIGP